MDTVVLFNEDIGVEVKTIVWRTALRVRCAFAKFSRHVGAPSQALETASNETDLADTALVLGSSLRVKPACELPAEIHARGGKLAIVNLERTPLDSRASLVNKW